MSWFRYWTLPLSTGTLLTVVCASLLAQGEPPKTDQLANSPTLEMSTAPAPPQVEEIPKENSPTPTAPSKDVEIKLLVLALQSKEEQLLVAKQEIAKLKKTLSGLRTKNVKELATLYYNKACVYRAARRFKLAEANFRQALALTPNDPAVHYNLGIVYDDNLQNPKAARHHYRRFLELAPNDKDAARVQEWLLSLEP